MWNHHLDSPHLTSPTLHIRRNHLQIKQLTFHSMGVSPAIFNLIPSSEKFLRYFFKLAVLRQNAILKMYLYRYWFLLYTRELFAVVDVSMYLAQIVNVTHNDFIMCCVASPRH